MPADLLPVEEEEIDVPSVSFPSALDEIKGRCEARGIEFSQRILNDGTQYALVLLNAGREKRELFIGSEEIARWIRSIYFEEYVFVSGFEAVCSYSKGTIEAAIRGLPFASSGVMRRLWEGGDGSSGELTITPPQPSPGQPVLRIGPFSQELQALLRGGP